MAETTSTPLVRRTEDITYEPLAVADKMSKGVLVNDEHGAKNVALRRFILEAGGSAPKHTNEIEHEQYVLDGEYTVGIDDTEYTVSTGDTVHIPAGAVHWYRNDGETDGVFLCAVPTGNDEIELVE